MNPMSNSPATSTPRVAQPRTILMCQPQYFNVTYQINPWMNPELPVSSDLAISQWQKLYDTYVELGMTVRLIDPAPGLPDMVYTANGGFVAGSVAYGAKFTYPQRTGEEDLFLDWFAANGYWCVKPEHTSEGEGDILLVDNIILAGYGFRSDLESHRELAEVFEKEVLSLHLIDPYFYHLDTALTILDPVPGASGPQIAYYPGAFDEPSLNLLKSRFPHAIEVSHADAKHFGLNSFSNGRHVVTSPGATDFHRQLEAAGYEPVLVDLSELRRGGGSIKCCTLEIRP